MQADTADPDPRALAAIAQLVRYVPDAARRLYGGGMAFASRIGGMVGRIAEGR